MQFICNRKSNPASNRPHAQVMGMARCHMAAAFLQAGRLSSKVGRLHTDKNWQLDKAKLKITLVYKYQKL